MTFVIILAFILLIKFPENCIEICPSVGEELTPLCSIYFLHPHSSLTYKVCENKQISQLLPQASNKILDRIYVFQDCKRFSKDALNIAENQGVDVEFWMLKESHHLYDFTVLFDELRFVVFDLKWAKNGSNDFLYFPSAQNDLQMVHWVPKRPSKSIKCTFCRKWLKTI